MKKIRIALVRGKHLNRFELQTFEPLTKDIDITAFGSKTILVQQFQFQVIKLFSPIDLVSLFNFSPLLYRIGLGFMNRLFIDAQYLFGLENKLIDFDIVHTADTYYHYTQQCLNAKRSGFVKKVVATIWENIPFNNEGIGGRRKFKQQALEEVDLFIATTKLSKQILIAEGCDSQKITVIYPGIDLDRFRFKKINSKKVNTILFVGRLVPEKGIWTILDTFTFLHNNYPELRLIICGEGPEKAKLIQATQKRNLSSSVIYINVPYKRMHNVYQQADIFVLASYVTRYWKEQFGMVLVEAMASGVPIVATYSGAIPEVIGNVGLLVPEKNTRALARAIEKLIKTKSLRQKLSYAGKKRVESLFNNVINSKKILNSYKKILPRSEAFLKPRN